MAGDDMMRCGKGTNKKIHKLLFQQQQQIIIMTGKMKIFFFSNIKQTYNNIELIEVYRQHRRMTIWEKQNWVLKHKIHIFH